MLNFIVDEKKCVKCAKCVNDCPGRIIKLSESKIPFIPADKEESCILCQHCLAVCPAAAISIDGVDPLKSVKAKNALLDPEKMDALVRCRRSYRSYLNENVDGAVIKKLLDAAANAPTGVNSRGVKFSVIDSREVMLKFKTEAMKRLTELSAAGKIPEEMAFFADFAQKWNEKKIDIIFRNAPHMIVSYAPKDCPTPETDCVIALSYFELYAQSMGIGTLWCGMAKWLVSGLLPELKKTLGIGEENVVGYFMLFGRPAVKYARGVQRKAENVNFVKM